MNAFSRTISFILLTAISLAIYLPFDFYLSHGYKSTLNYLFYYNQSDTYNNLCKSTIGAFVYDVFKIIPILIFLYLGIIWFDFFRFQKRKVTRWVIRIAQKIINVLKENKLFLKNLGRPARISLLCILGIQLFAFVYFVYHMPLSYDEWWSYQHFSGRGFWYSLSRYPVPNNHVFYNLISSQLVSLPLDIKFTLRISSVIASLFCTYLFLKLCKYFFGNVLSFSLLLIMMACFPFIMYGFQSRGYSFVCLFTVLLIYSSVHLLDNYKNYRKYRFYFMLSLVAGHLAIPSFLYASVPVILVLAYFLVSKKHYHDFFLLMKDGFLSVILIAISYSSILLFNDPNNLINPNGGVTKFLLSESKTFNIISQHYFDIGHYLIGYKEALLFVSIIMIVVLVQKKQTTELKAQYMKIVSLTFLISPIFILVIHRVLPFERTWIYLIIPLIICLGFIADAVFKRFSFDHLIGKYRTLRNYLFVVINVILVFLMLRFENNYHKVTLEFEEESLGEVQLKPLFGKIEKIARTEAGYEFHVSHIINAMSYYQSKNTYIEERILGEINNEDLLIIHSSLLPKYSNSIGRYAFVKRISGDLNVFVKDSLIKMIDIKKTEN